MKKTLFKKKIHFNGWNWIHVRTCPACKKTVNIIGLDTRSRPQLPPGAIVCNCGGLIPLGGG